MMRRIFTLYLLSATVCAMAQTAHLTLDDALSIGFENNPAIIAADYAERVAHRKRQSAVGLFMPKISIKGAYAHLNKDVKIDLNHLKTDLSGAIGATLAPYIPIIQGGLSSLLGVDFSYTLQQRNTAFLGGDVVMPIFAGGRIWTANKAAEIDEQRVQLQSKQVHGALTVEIVERYFGVELARHNVAIREEVMSVVKQHLRDVVLLEREGMAVESDRLYVECRLAEAERDLQRAQLQLATTRKALQTSLGIAEIVEPSTPLFIMEKIEPLDYFRAMAMLYNPKLGEIEQLRELARMDLRLHRAELFPEIAAMGGMLFCDHRLSNLVPRMAVGVGVNFKIFDGLNREYRLSAARLQLRRAEALERGAEQGIGLLVEESYNRVQSVVSTLPAVDRSVRLAEEFLRAKREAFAEGMATITDVVDAILSLSRARLERVQVAYEFDIALARLLNASGLGEMFQQYLHSKTAQSIL